MNFRVSEKWIWLPAIIAAMGLFSCSLQENNPSGFTIESVSASSVAGYRGLVNNCYFGMERQLYGFNQWMMFCEAGTDIWTYQKNGAVAATSQFFKYGAGSTFNLGTGATVWNVCYDGIGSCNTAIRYAAVAPFTTPEERNAMVAEAYFLRAMYYYNLVEQFGAVTLTIELVTTVDLHPEKTAPLEIYKRVIIPDLEFAVQWLPVNNGITKPSKKSALGFLARAYLQTVEYDDTKALAAKALETAKLLITDCEGGGATYNTFLYPGFDEVFLEANNYTNKESLWSHRFVVGGVSNNAWNMNMNNELFYGVLTDFGAIQQSGTDYTTWGRRSGGQFMPTAYLLNLYVQQDGTLDPRYHQSFQTSWTANKAYTWSGSVLKTYDRGPAVTTASSVAIGGPAIDFIHPNDAGYAAKAASKLNQKYLVVDYADVYNAANKSVKMQYNRVNRPLDDGGTLTTNPFFGFYPSLVKHNSSNYYTNNASNNRYGNLNATFMMRMSEVYLIAAEADVYANGGGNALGYLNKIRARAGAALLTGAVTVQTVLDERARELCGEYVRFYDLKRTKNLNKNYLMNTNPDVGQYFMDHTHKVRPIPPAFLNTLQGGGTYYQNPNY
jgi:hypothetical protein